MEGGGAVAPQGLEPVSKGGIQSAIAHDALH